MDNQTGNTAHSTSPPPLHPSQSPVITSQPESQAHLQYPEYASQSTISGPGDWTTMPVDKSTHPYVPAANPAPFQAPTPQQVGPVPVSGVAPPLQHLASSNTIPGQGVQYVQAFPPGNNWSSQIFDCFNPLELCFTSCVCPCIVFGKTNARLKDPTLYRYDTVNSDCLLYSLLSCCGLNTVYQWIVRRNIRAKYNLRGDDAEDLLWSCCCPVCALVQQEKEVSSHDQYGAQSTYAMQQPVMQQPVMQQPVMQQPVMQQPVMQQPTM